MAQSRINIQPDNLIAGLITPSISQSKSDLTEFYGAVSKNHDYGFFVLLNPGAKLVNQGGGEININPNLIQVIEPIGIAFEISKQKVMEIIKKLYFEKIYQERMPQKFIVAYGIKLTCKYKIGEDDNSANNFVSKQIQLGSDRLKLLGEVDKLMMGLRFNFSTNGGQHDLKIEPWLADAARKTLWIELDVLFPGGPLQTILSQLENKIDGVRNYFMKDVKDFIEYWGQP